MLRPSAATMQLSPTSLVTPKRNALVPFRSRLLFATLLTSALVAAIVTGVLHFLLVANGRSSVTIATALTAVEVAASIDAETVRTLAASHDASHAPEAEPLREHLRRARERMRREFPPWFNVDPYLGAARLGIIVPDNDAGAARLLLTTDNQSEGAPYAFGFSPMPEVRWNAISFDEEIVNDARGPHLGGRAPIRDAQGNTVGLVLIETDAKYFASLNQVILSVCIVIFLGTMVISFVLASALAFWLVRPIKTLTAAMATVASGDLSVSVPRTRRGDEFDALTDRFNDMVRGLREREKMNRDLTTAREVQNHLLPRQTPTIAGYETLHAVHYCELTGGDYVDVFPAPSHAGLWGLTVADVSGHGIPAAMLMSWTRAMVRAQASSLGEDLTAMLRGINTHLVRDSGGSAFLTMFFGFLDTHAHRLRWASAGHDPALLVRARTGTVEHLCATDVPLGVLDDAPLPPGDDATLEPGDLLMVCSDGLAQTRSRSGEYFGLTRIESILRSHAAHPLRDVIDELLRQASVHRSDQVQDDDITLLLVRRNAVP